VSLFSGLALYSSSADSELTFLGTTDRGPNQGCKDLKDERAAISGGTCTSTNATGCNDWGRAYYGLDTYKERAMNTTSADTLGQGFPVPHFSPGFVALRADTTTGTLSVAASCSLWYPGAGGARVPATGLPNWQAGPYLPSQRDNVPCELGLGVG
jgi:hypothetical protein